MTPEPQTLTEVARALEAREVTSEAITERCLARIADRNASVNAFISVFAAEALAEARAADREIAAGRHRGPLHGVPISLKDLFDVRGTPTTAASHVRKGHVAASDAAVVARLRQSGAVIVGKTNLHEFALGTTNEDSAFGPARHPLDLNRSPGGSSGGSAASVLAGMAYASVGTDTGGSVRIPSAACGLVGLKPTCGELSTAGVVPLSATLDHVGPICRSVADAEIMYAAMRGHEQQLDSPRTGGATAAPKAIRLGMLRGYFTEMLDSDVASRFDRACTRLRDAGVELTDVDIPHAGQIASIYLHVVLAEAAAYHAKTLDSRPDDYTPNVRMRLEMGRYILAADYVRARKGCEVLRQEVDAALNGRNGLLLPALAVPATRLGAATVRMGSVEEPVRNITLRLTQLFNLTGHPAITVPCGSTPEGLPVGAQMVGRRHDTPALLAAARALEPYLGPGMSG